MQLAIQEDMLPGRAVQERLEHAQRLGLAGVEFWADSLTVRVPEINEALQATGLKASAVNLGRQDGYLSADGAKRELAINRMRQAMADALDLSAEHVIFVPQYGAPDVPDLTPYQSPLDLERELLIWLLRTVSDLAYALGVNLHIQPVNRYEAHLINRVEQAKTYRKKIKDHPHVKIAPNLFHMALEEADIAQTLADHADDLDYILLADNNRRLPGQGLINWTQIINTLKQAGYDGWLTFECGQPGQNQWDAYRYYDGLPACIELLKSAGMA